MIRYDRDPSELTQQERFTEISEILAIGYVRMMIASTSPDKALDDGAPSEASCGSRAKNPDVSEDAA